MNREKDNLDLHKIKLQSTKLYTLYKEDLSASEEIVIETLHFFVS